MYFGAFVLCPVSIEPLVSFGNFFDFPFELLFCKAVIPNYHYYSKFPPFLLVNDLSLAAQRKLRLQAGTPLTSCSYTYFCAFSYLLYSLSQSCVPFS